MKFLKHLLLYSLLLVGFQGQAQTTLSGVTLTGVSINSSAVAYDADYQAWLDRLTTLGYTHPSAACNQILSDMVAGIKSDGNWTSLDRFWFFAHNGDSDGATVDMVTPTNQATKVNSPGWTAKEGFNSNGTTSYVNSQFNLSTAAHFLQNSASMGVWIHTGGNAGISILGVRDTGSGDFNTLLFDTGGGNVGSRLNQNTTNNSFTGTTSFNNNSSYGVSRTASNSGNQYVNGSSVSTFSTTSSTPANLNVYILAQNSNNVASSIGSSLWKLSVSWFGSGSVNQSEMHTRLNTAMTAIALLP